MYLSQEIIDEVEEVIKRGKFKEILVKTNQNPDEIIRKILSVSHLVFGAKLNIKICRDPKDGKFIECAVHAKVDYLVSGDEDLLSLKQYKEIKIVKSSEVLNFLK